MAVDNSNNNKNISSSDRYDRFLVSTDKFLDRVPLVSTGTNLIDIIVKCCLKSVQHQGKPKDFYGKYLDDKSFFRCFLLLIPGLGNLVVFVYDRWTEKKPETAKVSESTPNEKIVVGVVVDETAEEKTGHFDPRFGEDTPKSDLKNEAFINEWLKEFGKEN